MAWALFLCLICNAPLNAREDWNAKSSWHELLFPEFLFCIVAPCGHRLHEDKVILLEEICFLGTLFGGSLWGIVILISNKKKKPGFPYFEEMHAEDYRTHWRQCTHCHFSMRAKMLCLQISCLHPSLLKAVKLVKIGLLFFSPNGWGQGFRAL